MDSENVVQIQNGILSRCKEKQNHEVCRIKKKDGLKIHNIILWFQSKLIKKKLHVLPNVQGPSLEVYVQIAVRMVIV